MSKAKSMVDEGTTTEMVAPQEEKKAVLKGKYKSKVNMHLPSGTVLKEGEHAELTDEDHAHLKKHFPNDARKHIFEE